MPELPECEANRRRVEAETLHRTIEAVSLGDDVAHVELPDGAARDRLVGRQFTETHRHGKLIFAGSKSGPWIAVHLGMTGSLRPYDGAGAAPDYARITIAFEGDRRLAFRCPRKFGWVRVVDGPDGVIDEAGMGPDALQIDADAFAERLGGSRAALKSALMDQKKLAGIGNLWSDETLYRAGLHPETRAGDLSRDRVDALRQTMREVLQGVLDVDARYGDLPRDWLIHRREADADCPLCGGRIATAKVGGRTAYFCPQHQGAA